MSKNETNIAYRCPECGFATFGFIGKFALKSNLVRLKCACGDKSSLDISVRSDKKIELSVPCVFCKTNHSFVISEGIFFDKELFPIKCPYANTDIAFVGEKDAVDEAVKKNTEELNALVTALELDDFKDMQPSEVDECEVLPDPEIYDAIRFLVKELEADGKINCPCKVGSYEVRYTDHSIEVYCEECGATYEFNVPSMASAHELIELDEITLK